MPPRSPRKPEPPAASKRTVVLGLLGTQLDLGKGPQRWDRWRPTVSIGQHEDLVVHRFELLGHPRFRRAAESVADDLRSVSPETEVRVHGIPMNEPWSFEAVYQVLYDFADGYPFDTEREEYWIHITTGSHVAQICLFLLTESRHLPGKLLQTSPPPKHSDAPGEWALIDLDLARYDPIARRFDRARETANSMLKSGIDTRNARFNRLIEELERVALRSREPILLMGPTGAGKSRLASQLWELKRQRHQLTGPFVEINCATLRGDAAGSALFGHEKGAFTGAGSARAGLLRTADGGVLFLDEIGELGLDEQAMLLRALEEKRFLPLGADQEVASDFQLVAGTNRDLRHDVAEGRFRGDLLARIDLWTYELPGLADRLEDLEPNLDYELERYGRDSGRRVTFNREARARYLRFARSPGARWTGNFRDLAGSVTRMATLCPGGRIDVETVREEVARLRRDWSADPESGGTPEAELLRHLDDAQVAELDLFDRAQLAAVLEVCARSDSLSAAGRVLFAASRARRKSVNDADRLRKYLARFDLDWKGIRERRG